LSRGAAAAILALAILVAGQAAEVPRISSPQPEFNFGAVDNTRTVEHAFEIRNDGQAPLVIGDIRTCCGGSGRISATNIPPGSNACLTASLSLRGRKGPQRKTVYVASNDPAQPYYQVWLTGTAVAAVDIEPARLDFATVKADAPATNTATIVCQAEWRFRITNATCSSRSFAWQVQPAGEGRHLVTVWTVPPLPPGMTKGTLALQTDHPQYREAQIPLTALVLSGFYVVPSEILLAGTNGPGSVSRYVAIRSRDGRPFRILRIEVPDPGIKTNLVELPHAGYRIELSNILAFGGLDGQHMVIVTDCPETPRIVLPFRIVDEQQNSK
jgi:hypothetical protein